MSVPTTRDEFKEFCLRMLGKPVIEINVDEDQVDDRLDQALRFYWDYHFDGTELVYYKQQITANDISTGYFTLPENIIGAVKVFNVGNPLMSSGSNMFNIRYQIALNDLYSMTSVSMVPYYMMRQHLELISEILVGQTPIRYSRHRDRLYIDGDKEALVVGQYLLVQAYEVLDPDEFPDIWADRWLQYYTAQLIKRQWGTNLTKFEGMQLPGGVTFNGTKIYDDAHAEVLRLEEEMTFKYSLPPMDMLG